MSIPRPEYPRPQFVRADWLNLNGTWQFEADYGDSGIERGVKDRALTGTITVPFCPESKLSGLEHVDFLNAVWYRKEVAVPASWADKVVLLHFGAVDYDTTVWADGVEVARHRGGFTPFSANLGKCAGQTVTIVVRARDKHGVPQARGKQANKFAPYACFYTRTTGIWQTVWLEPVSDIAMKRPRITPDLANSRFELVVPLTAHGPGPNVEGLTLTATLTDASGVVSTASVRADLDFAARLILDVPENRKRVWSTTDPHLYGITLTLAQGETVLDSVESYAGLRSVALSGMAFKLNGEIVFQRTVLDQGYWPESVMTAPSDDELRLDIERSIAAGFNGARLHQKVFEERFFYWADKLGYLVWGEFGDWGCSGFGPSTNHQQPDASYIAQWLEAVERDYSHPSIVGWCPLNETFQENSDQIRQLDDVTRGMWLATKLADATRPVLDTSGYAHRVRESDIYDSHDYEQDPVKFGEKMAGLKDGKPFINNGWDNKPTNIPYGGQPYFCSEFGGIWWNPAAFDNKESWGYGERVKSLEEFYARFEGLCDVLLGDKNMFGYCYTQLTDIYPEENGVYTFDRKPKFDNEKLKAVQTKKAVIEK
ncbi:sugar-binding domain-containing protein [Armatimonas sp.]|uniref:glycoside hydrolase family 2 protein n=1 Tax=Armatimonas sp. TaxID=1872638 RepID=UPI00286B5648|nr:sugar-binding domain-containing protein [Armatimonas sp.]